MLRSQYEKILYMHDSRENDNREQSKNVFQYSKSIKYQFTFSELYDELYFIEVSSR